MSTSTQAILSAITTAYAATAGDAIRTAGSTGLYFGRAPQSAVYPFVVMTIPASLSEPTIGQGTNGGAIYNDIDIDVGVFDDSRSPNRGMTILGAWHVAFNFAGLTLASPYRMVIGHKVSDAIPIEEPDQKGWHTVATYGYNISE